MYRSIALAGLVCLTNLAVCRAVDIQGTVIVKQKLTKRKVTASVSSYQRGTAVELGEDQKENPLAWERTRVVVYLEGEMPSKPVNATLEQKGRRFTPDTIVVPAGSAIAFPNLDPIFHNVFSLSKAKSFDLGNYPKDHTRSVTFPTAGIVFVNCHLHPNMGAVIVVSPNAWSTKADGDGHFNLPEVPPGNYTIVAWHKTAGFFRQQLRVTANRAPAVEFIIPITEAPPARALAQR